MALNRTPQKLVKVTLYVLFFAGSLYVLFNPAQVRYSVLDWYRRNNYQPSQDIQTIVEDIKLTGEGQQLFYATQPQLVAKENFAEYCPSSERANVLGCYSNDLTYILNIDEPSLLAVKEVTAVHELLHGVWARLSDGQKDELAQELKQAYQELENERIIELVRSYEADAPPGDTYYIANELHSILGTEVRGLSDQLEQHYAQHLEDRDHIVTLFESYNDEFERREQRVEELGQELEQLRGQIQQKNDLIDQLSSENEQLVARINELRAQGKTAESNRLVPQQNALVARVRREVSDVNRLINEYNNKVEENNELALELNELAESLDSRSSDVE